MTTTIVTGHPNGQILHTKIKIGKVVLTHEDTLVRKSVVQQILESHARWTCVASLMLWWPDRRLAGPQCWCACDVEEKISSSTEHSILILWSSSRHNYNCECYTQTKHASTVGSRFATVCFMTLHFYDPTLVKLDRALPTCGASLSRPKHPFST